MRGVKRLERGEGSNLPSTDRHFFVEHGNINVVFDLPAVTHQETCVERHASLLVPDSCGTNGTWYILCVICVFSRFSRLTETTLECSKDF